MGGDFGDPGALCFLRLRPGGEEYVSLIFSACPVSRLLMAVAVNCSGISISTSGAAQHWRSATVILPMSYFPTLKTSIAGLSAQGFVPEELVISLIGLVLHGPPEPG